MGELRNLIWSLRSSDSPLARTRHIVGKQNLKTCTMALRPSRDRCHLYRAASTHSTRWLFPISNVLTISTPRYRTHLPPYHIPIPLASSFSNDFCALWAAIHHPPERTHPISNTRKQSRDWRQRTRQRWQAVLNNQYLSRCERLADCIEVLSLWSWSALGRHWGLLSRWRRRWRGRLLGGQWVGQSNSLRWPLLDG